MADAEQSVHTAEEAPSVGVGEGSMPGALMRFNWGAFCLPVLWGAAYGVWPIVGLWFVASFAPLFVGIIGGVTTASGAVSMPALIGVTVVSDAFLGFVRIWSGASANRLYWERESRRLSADSTAKPKFDLARFSARQRVWTGWGVVSIAIGLALTSVSNYSQLKLYGVQWAFIAESVAFLIAEVALAIWFAGRMREEFPEEPRVMGAYEDAAGDDYPASGKD